MFISHHTEGARIDQMTVKMYLLKILLLMCLIEAVKSRNRVFCYAEKNEYYIPAGDICKECDKCGPGLELEPLKDAKLKTSQTNGAIGCRICVPCKGGFFSNKRSFQSCKPCKNCDVIGKTMTQPCTPQTNTKCGRKAPRPTSSVPDDTTKMQDTTSQKGGNSSDQGGNSASQGESFGYNKITFILVVCTVCFIFVGVICCCCFYKRICHGKESLASLSGIRRDRIADKFKEPIKTESPLNDIMTDGEFKEPIKTESPLNDIVTDGDSAEETSPFLLNNNELLEYKELTSKQLMFIAKRIAPKSGYREVALELGVPEEDISIIEQDNPKDVLTTSYKVLKKWTERSAKATVKTLIDVLNHVGRRDVINAFWKESYNNSPATSSSNVSDD